MTNDARLRLLALVLGALGLVAMSLVGCDATQPAEAEEEGFDFTRYDEVPGEVEGGFEGIFAVDPDLVRIPQRELPNTLRVTEGQFRAVVKDCR